MMCEYPHCHLKWLLELLSPVGRDPGDPFPVHPHFAPGLPVSMALDTWVAP